MAPRIPKLREAMQQQHRLALAALCDVKLNLAKLNLLVRDCGHALSL
jgi:hypothetical protein